MAKTGYNAEQTRSATEAPRDGYKHDTGDNNVPNEGAAAAQYKGVSVKCNSPSDGPSNSRRRTIRIPSDHVGGYLSVVLHRTGE